ncbi:MAG: aminoacyl-tRNA hydrolase [Planctomycetes bacterium]|nr:aminoacyl-tRNA hydrolase [Planctomycetota bacterium]
MKHTINRVFSVNREELQVLFARSGGPGGQNINRRETKVTLKWNFKTSGSLTDGQKKLIQTRLRNRINEEGDLIVTCTKTRHQKLNYDIAVELLNDLVSNALRPRLARRPTSVPRSKMEERLKDKRLRSLKKKGRSGVWE